MLAILAKSNCATRLPGARLPIKLAYVALVFFSSSGSLINSEIDAPCQMVITELSWHREGHRHVSTYSA